MPRIRSIKPEFWTDPVVQRWPAKTRLAYIALWNYADDEGRFRADSVLLMTQLMPFDPVTDEDFAPIVAAGKVRLYTVGGEQYGVIPHFKRHQKPNRPTGSKLPEEPEGNRHVVNAHGGLSEYSVNAHCGLTDGSLPERRGVGGEKEKEKERNPPKPPKGGGVLASPACEGLPPVEEKPRRRRKKSRPELDQRLIALWQEKSGEPHRESAAKNGKARLNAGYTEEDLSLVATWCRYSNNFSHQREKGYLRPQTVWGGDKFDSYLVSARKARGSQQKKEDGKQIGWAWHNERWMRKRKSAAEAEGLKWVAERPAA